MVSLQLSLLPSVPRCPCLLLTWGKGIVAVHPLSVDDLRCAALVCGRVGRCLFVFFWSPPFPSNRPSRSGWLLGWR